MLIRALFLLFLVACLAGPGCDSGGDSGDKDDTVQPAEDTATPEDTVTPAEDTAAPEDTTPSEDTPQDTEKVVEPHCAALLAGWNPGFPVDGEDRTLILTLPDDVETRGPWPVIFNYHGYGDTAANMESLLKFLVNDEDYPFILVTPEDLNLPLGEGVDWDILKLGGGDSKEARMFDEVLECVDQRWGVDRDRIHLTGFSAGGITASSIGVLRGEQIASIATWSGAYFSNPENAIMFATWPEMTVQNPYPQLLIHGGAPDVWSAVVIELKFGEMNVSDAQWLEGMGHPIILCDHGSGHTIPYSLMGWAAHDFFAAHPRGIETLPWPHTLPEGWPDYCEPY